MPDDVHINLARSLHDGLAQELVGLGYRVDLLLSDDGLSSQGRGQLREIRSEITRITAAIRDEIFQLREASDERFEDFLRRVTDNLDHAVTITLNNLAVAKLSSNPVIDMNLRFVADELLRNTIAHAGAAAIEISLELDKNLLILIVSDDGNGAVRERVGHFGIQGIKERILEMGGEFGFEIIAGTRAWVRIPLHPSLS